MVALSECAGTSHLAPLPNRDLLYRFVIKKQFARDPRVPNEVESSLLIVSQVT